MVACGEDVSVRFAQPLASVLQEMPPQNLVAYQTHVWYKLIAKSGTIQSEFVELADEDVSYIEADGISASDIPDAV
jgi:hypothetical protein